VVVGADDELARLQEWARQVVPLTDGLGRRPWRARVLEWAVVAVAVVLAVVTAVELFAWSARGGVPTQRDGTAVLETGETVPRCDDPPPGGSRDRPSSVVKPGADGPVLVMCRS
jgi:hypothetical protein